VTETLTAVPFVGFPKIYRYSRDVIVTEKIDGTNAQVFINEDLSTVLAGSRNRWVSPGDDGFGFASWVAANADELRKLGPGSHFGEWWGSGIQRKYGLKEKRFSLFNVSRWADDSVRPKCCHVVPELWRGSMDDFKASAAIFELSSQGSRAAPGFMDPEGIVIFHVASGALFKKTVKNDEKHKGEL
jgi:hypothetical protein